VKAEPYYNAKGWEEEYKDRQKWHRLVDIFTIIHILINRFMRQVHYERPKKKDVEGFAVSHNQDMRLTLSSRADEFRKSQKQHLQPLDEEEEGVGGNVVKTVRGRKRNKRRPSHNKSNLSRSSPSFHSSHSSSGQSLGRSDSTSMRRLAKRHSSHMRGDEDEKPISSPFDPEHPSLLCRALKPARIVMYEMREELKEFQDEEEEEDEEMVQVVRDEEEVLLGRTSPPLHNDSVTISSSSSPSKKRSKMYKVLDELEMVVEMVSLLTGHPAEFSLHFRPPPPTSPSSNTLQSNNNLNEWEDEEEDEDISFEASTIMNCREARKLIPSINFFPEDEQFTSISSIQAVAYRSFDLVEIHMYPDEPYPIVRLGLCF